MSIMKKSMYKFLSLFFVLLLLFAGCQNPTVSNNETVPVSESASAQESVSAQESTVPEETVAPTEEGIKYSIGLAEGDNEEFNTFLMDLFAKFVTSDSITFHYTMQNPKNYGISMETVTLGNPNLDSLEADYEKIKEQMAELKSFDYNQLSSRQQVIYDIIEDALVSSEDSYNYALYDVIFSPTTGIQAQLPIVMNEYIFYTSNDVDDYILLLKDIPNYFRQLLDIEKLRSEEGLFMSDATVDAIVEQCEAFIEIPEENLLIDIFNDKLTNELPDLSDAQKTEYVQKNKEAVLNDVIPAYRMVIDELTALKGTGVNENGLAHFEQGKDYYTVLAKGVTGSSKSVEEMIEFTDKELLRDITLIRMLASKDASLYDRMVEFSPELTDPTAILNQLQTAILSEYPKPVSKDFTIKYVHESLEEDLSPAFYMIPAIDAMDANTIYINNYQNEDSDNATFFATLAHEGYPGHLYQQTMFNSTNPHPIYGVISYKGYAEGWATYVEQQSFAWAGADENLARILKANQDFGLAISARVDMGVNYEGWTRTDTAEYLYQFGLDDEETVNNIFDYVVAEPAAYLSYYIGAHEFWDLRQLAEESLGKQFDPIKFHEFILSFGPAPFDLIEEHLNTWIQEQLSSDSANKAA